MKTQPRYFGIDYFWIEDGQRKTGRTVVNGLTESHARARFQRQHRHVTVIAPRPQ